MSARDSKVFVLSVRVCSIPSADGPSADGTVPSSYILPNLPTFCPICIQDKMSANLMANLPTPFESCIAHLWVFVL